MGMGSKGRESILYLLYHCPINKCRARLMCVLCHSVLFALCIVCVKRRTILLCDRVNAMHMPMLAQQSLVCDHPLSLSLRLSIHNAICDE